MVSKENDPRYPSVESVADPGEGQGGSVPPNQSDLIEKNKKNKTIWMAYNWNSYHRMIADKY